MAVLAFHKIEPSLTVGINNYNPRRLEKLLVTLKETGYCFLDMEQYLAADVHDRAIATVTFDDGYESFYTRAFPILQSLEVPATVFVPTDFIGLPDSWDYASAFNPARHLSREQIRELSDKGITFGSHGVSHRCLAGLSPRLLKLELERSKKKLEDITGRRMMFLSYPFGRFTPEVEAQALESGYERGFSLASYRTSRFGFTVSRLGVYTIDTPLAVAAKINGGILSRMEKFKGAIINAYASGTILLHRLRAQQPPEPH